MAATKTKTKSVSIESIVFDAEVQPRAKMCEETIAEYAELLESKADQWPFPPCVLFDDSTSLLLASGFHRVLAAQRAGRTEVECEVRKGSRREAILFASSTNADHGRRRTNEDKRRVVSRLLSDKEWSKRSARWIADACAVSPALVATVREELPSLPLSAKDNGKLGKAETKDGRQYPSERKNLSTPKQPPIVPEEPAPGSVDRLASAVRVAIENRAVRYTQEGLDRLGDFDKQSQSEMLRKINTGEFGSIDEAVGLVRPDEPSDNGEPELPEELSIADQMKEWNRQVESFARKVTALLSEAPEGPWLDKGRLDIAMDQLKSAAGTIRLAKCEHECPACETKGCKRCRKTGYMPKREFQKIPAK